MVYDSEFVSETMDWKDLYGDIKKYISPGMLDPLGKNSHMTCFVDAKHDGKIVTRCFHTVVLIYLMNAPVIWFSKNWNTLERSMFYSEFLAMWIPRDLIVMLR